MAHAIAHLLLTVTLTTSDAQRPPTPAVAPVIMRCADEGVVAIADQVHITCDGVDLSVPASAIRNITLAAARPRFFIPLWMGPGGGAAIPVGHKHDRVELAVLGRDGLEHRVFLQVKEDDLPAGLSAFSRLTGLPVLTEHLEDRLAAAGVPQTVGQHRTLVSPEQRARAEDLSPSAAEVTDAGDSVIVYLNGRSILWNPAAMTVRPLGESGGGGDRRRCFPNARVIGIHQRTAAVYSCGRVVAYDLDSGAAWADVAVEDPGAAALNGGDGALYWLEAGQLRRRRATLATTEALPTPFAERFTRLAFSPRGDLLLCSRGWTRGKDATDLYIYKFDGGAVGAAVRIHDLEGHNPAQVGVHPDSSWMATVEQRWRRWRLSEIEDVITFWTLQPVPKKEKEVRLPKGVDAAGHPLRYSTDGSTVVTGGRSPLSIDSSTGTIRCAVPEPLREVTRPNQHGLSAGIAYEGWQIGDPPRAVVWNSLTCEVRSTLNPELAQLPPTETAKRPGQD